MQIGITRENHNIVKRLGGPIDYLLRCNKGGVYIGTKHQSSNLLPPSCDPDTATQTRAYVVVRRRSLQTDPPGLPPCTQHQLVWASLAHRKMLLSRDSPARKSILVLARRTSVELHGTSLYVKITEGVVTTSREAFARPKLPKAFDHRKGGILLAHGSVLGNEANFVLKGED